jgi:iron(III) transport system ATP-binding protein
MNRIVVTGLHKSFGAQPVLIGIDLEVPAESFTAILGPSGSGKTTLLRVIAGLERADLGSVAIGDATVDGDRVHVPAERRRLGYVSQEGSLFPHLSVQANVGFGLARSERRGRRVTELLDAVGLGGLGRRYPHQLSGGQQQRVAVARALAVRPQAVLLDEPFASLDAQLRSTVRADVREILRSAGTTALLVTHDQDEALSVADFVAVIRDGRIAQFATPQELYARPVDADLARFVGAANLVEGVLDGGVVETAFGKLDADVASVTAGAVLRGPATVLVRPEQLEIVGLSGTGIAAAGADPEHSVTGRVLGTSYHGHDALVKVRPDRRLGPECVVARILGDPRLADGSVVMLSVRGPVLTWPATSGYGGEAVPTLAGDGRSAAAAACDQ